MAQANDIEGIAFERGSAVLLARVLGPDNQTPLVQADLNSAKYTAYELDPIDPDDETPVAGHQDVNVPVNELIYDELQTDALWGTEVDSIGYNFKHVLDVTAAEIFQKAGRSYRLVFTLTPPVGQAILVRFRLSCI